jgi:site-specific recombinase XerD
MRWAHWIGLYTQTHCTARGLRPATIAAYAKALEQFRAWVRFRAGDVGPEAIAARDVLTYIESLRRERHNGDAAVNRHVVVLRGFYRAMVAMGELEAQRNPLAHFPKLRPPQRKLPRVLSEPEVERLLEAPESDTVLGLRDRALLQLLYGTGLRASEAASLRERDVDLEQALVTVSGKGGHERSVPLNAAVSEALRGYRRARGRATPEAPFFVSRRGRALTRGAVYERVRTGARRARLSQRVSPHRLRHTFATHLVRAGVGIVTIRDLLGHRQITSTQLYLHVTAQDLREAADRHPIARLAPLVAPLLPGLRLPFQRVLPPRRAARLA